MNGLLFLGFLSLGYLFSWAVVALGAKIAPNLDPKTYPVLCSRTPNPHFKDGEFLSEDLVDG